jgi:serine/threonine-protein kinase
MEYVDGQTLAARLSSGPLSWQDAVRICADVATGLAGAHAQGLVHRDVKPGNVILSGSHVKVVDFGIAAACGRDQSQDGGVVFGTRAYMAPELLTDATAQPANDMYAFGLVLRECLTGERAGALADRATEPAPADTDGPAAPLPRDVPAAVSALVGDCLATTPRLRPTAADAAAILHRALVVRHPDGGRLRTATPISEQPTVPAGVTEPAEPTRWRPQASRRRSERRRMSVPQTALVAASAAVLTIPLVMQLPGMASDDGTSGDARASTAPAPHGPPRRPADDCVANFSARYLPDGTFTGMLDITWTGTRSLSPWSVEFALPDRQRLVGADPGRLVQDHGTVTITSQKPLDPGETVSVALQGVAADRAEAPRRFELDGRTCIRSTSDVKTTTTVPGPTRTVHLTPDAGTTPDGPQTPDRPPASSRPPASPSREPSSPDPSSPETSGPGPSASTTATGGSSPPSGPSPPDPVRRNSTASCPSCVPRIPSSPPRNGWCRETRHAAGRKPATGSSWPVASRSSSRFVDHRVVDRTVGHHHIGPGRDADAPAGGGEPATLGRRSRRPVRMRTSQAAVSHSPASRMLPAMSVGWWTPR